MIQVEAFIRSFKVSWTPRKETDVVGYRVHAVKASELVGGNFIPTENNMIYEGPETTVLHVLPEGVYGGMYYIKVGAYDTFGTDEMVYSDLVSLNVPDLQIMPDELFTTLRTDFYVRDVTFLFGQIDKITGIRSNEKTLYWDEGWIDQFDKTYVLPPGEMEEATCSYIIATLTDDPSAESSSGIPAAGFAALRKVPFGDGLPEVDKNEIIIVVTSCATNGVGNYMAYVRQGNSFIVEGAYIRDATIGDAKIYGTLSANKITTLNGGVVITDNGITLNDMYDTSANAYLNAEESLERLSEIVDDNKITPDEKSKVLKEYNTIVAEYFTIIAQANKYSVSTTAYTTAYSALTSYIPPLLANMGITSNITGSVFRSKFVDYYTARTTLLKEVSDIAKNGIDNAQTTANNANSTAINAINKINDMSNDDVITPAEKLQLKTEYDIIYAEYSKIITQAQSYGINTTAYTTAYNIFVNYVSPLLANMNTSNNISGASLRNYIANYYSAQIDLLNNIADKTATTAAWGGLSNTPTGYNILKDTLGNGLNITSSFIGFYGGGSVASYLDNLGNFYLQGSDPNHSLTWSSSSNTLRVRGDVEASSFKSTSFVLNGPNGQIRSANYVPGASGWAVDYLGQAEFRNVIVRGDVEASKLKANTAMVETLNIAGDSVIVPSSAFVLDTSTKTVTAYFTVAGLGAHEVVPAMIHFGCVYAASQIVYWSYVNGNERGRDSTNVPIGVVEFVGNGTHTASISLPGAADGISRRMSIMVQVCKR